MTDYIFTTSVGEEIPVIIETRRGLRNITLRPKTRPVREIRISKPWMASKSSAIKFLEQKAGWIENVMAKSPQKVQIKDGDVIEFLGKSVKIQQDSNQRSNFYISDDVLVIGGSPEMLERRVRDFIKKEFEAEVKKIIKTTPKEFWPKKICLRDTSSRWGSCSTTGTISFSWRLAFAPYEVMRYVVIHELAHTKHMDHSVHFWATVSQLYGDGVGRAKLWLSKNGQSLHQYF